MSTTRDEAAEPPALLDPKTPEHGEGLSIEVHGEEEVDKKLAQIEMAGEEVAAGWAPAPHAPLSPELPHVLAPKSQNSSGGHTEGSKRLQLMPLPPPSVIGNMPQKPSAPQISVWRSAGWSGLRSLVSIR